jgi:hypothetical protein
MDMMKKLKNEVQYNILRYLHVVAHLTDLYSGEVECWWQENKLMVGFRCRTCKKLEGIHESRRLKQASKIIKEGRA